MRPLTLIALLTTVACGTSDAVQPFVEVPDPALDEPGPPLPPPSPAGTLEMSHGDLAIGQSVTLSATGAAPGETVHFVRSTRGFAGGSACPAPLGGLCLDLQGPVHLLGSATADSNGDAELTFTLPATLTPGASLYLQAAVVRGIGGVDSVKSHPVVGTLVDATAPPACDGGVEIVGDSAYLLCNNAASWFDARDSCDALGGGLLTLDSATEEGAVLAAAGTGDWWLGYNDLAVESFFSWWDGSPAVYLNWAAGQPDDGCGPMLSDVTVEVLSGSGTWELTDDSWFLSSNNEGLVAITDVDADAAPIRFEVEVQTPDDDDFVGFALGLSPGELDEPDADWLLVDWKQADQDNASGGLAVSRVQGEAIFVPDSWEHTGNVTELARGATLGSVGWADHTPYVFDVEYSTSRLQVWVDGVLEIDLAGSFPQGEFALYSSSQPSVLFTVLEPVEVCRGTEDCAELRVDSADWNDQQCETAQGYVCEVDVTASGAACDGQIRYHDGAAYAFCTTPTDWLDASSTCSALGMTLVTVDDQDEHRFLTDEIDAMGGGAWWLGLSDSTLEGQFDWADGTGLFFTHWEVNQPDNANNEDCVELRSSTGYEWNDRDCATLDAFVCEG